MTAFRADERMELMSPIRLRRNWTDRTSSSALLVLKAASLLKLDDMEMIYYVAHMIDLLLNNDDQIATMITTKLKLDLRRSKIP
jgi:hypothetical protein